MLIENTIKEIFKIIVILVYIYLKSEVSLAFNFMNNDLSS